MSWDNNRLHTEHSAGVLPENALISCPVNLERYPAYYMKINTYWFCFAVTFGCVAILPVFYISVQPSSPKSLNIFAAGYALDSFDQSWKDWLFLVQVITASAIALISAVASHWISERHKTTTRATLMQLLVLTAIIAAVLAAFSVFSATMACCSLIPFGAYALSIYLIGWLDLNFRHRAHQDAG